MLLGLRSPCTIRGSCRIFKLWVTDFERHEALLDLAVVKGHRWRSVAAGRRELRAA
jgi:hypothetical protein